ncbi:hypothetical protein [Aliterella atlantica]|uniref:CopG family transcriptional regulator n=1 Tax=Aliterella atlantica CENA595 TaxID=1618023 RepID=A0A0D8ZXM9_9CYAN|nr:hypothetical protein [Aliterella atlantica]KJH71971.1 hypothetical protein UH38_09665 [Aliterella atlantica CENA595]
MPKSDEQKAVSVYMPLDLYQQLVEFKEKENIRSDSMAINLLLRQCFGNPTPDRSDRVNRKMNQLKAEIADIASRLQQVEQKIAK